MIRQVAYKYFSQLLHTSSACFPPGMAMEWHRGLERELYVDQIENPTLWKKCKMRCTLLQGGSISSTFGQL